MPELAEVEFFRKRWDHAATGERIVRVSTHDTKKLLRKVDAPALRAAIEGTTLVSSATSAKQMVFCFNGGAWLGIHLGMSGELFAAAPDYSSGKHDHLVLRTARHALVFRDPRMFGRIEFHVGETPPEVDENCPRHPVAGVLAGSRHHILAPPRPFADQGRAADAGAVSRRRQLDGRRDSLARRDSPGAPRRIADCARNADALARMPPRLPARTRHDRRPRPSPPPRSQREHPPHLAFSAPLGGRRALSENRSPSPARKNRRAHHVLVTRAPAAQG